MRLNLTDNQVALIHKGDYINAPQLGDNIWLTN